MRVVWAVVGLTLAAALACTTDYQQGLDDPKYAGPNALADQQPPGGSTEQTAGGGGGTSGATATDTPACVTKGGTVIPPEQCAVTFASILAGFQAASCTSASCHGNGNPAPLISADKNATYTALTKFVGTTAKPYVNPCSKDLTASSIAQNIDPAAPTGERGTLMPPSVGVKDATLLANVKTWVACGAPNN
ncbi:MAG: hypothetical protein U0270_13990 [Labilithrix sp.]